MKKISVLAALLIAVSACGTSEDIDLTIAEPSDLYIEHLGGQYGKTVRLHWKDNAEGEYGYYLFTAGEKGTGTAEPSTTVVSDSDSYTFVFPAQDTTWVLGVQTIGSQYKFSKRVWCKERVTTYRSPVDPIPGPGPDPDPNPIEEIIFNWTEVTAPAGVSIYETTDPLNGRAFHAWYAIADPKEVAVRVLYPGGGKKATIDKQAEDAGNCLVLVNGGIFGTAPIGFALLDGEQTPWRYIEDDNWAVDKQYWGPDNKLHTVSRGLFGVDQTGKPGVYWSFTPSYGTVRVYDKPIPSVAGEAVQKEADETFPCAPADWQPYNALTCGPVLLQNGRCPITNKKTAKGYWETNYEMWADDIYGVDQLADRTAVGYTADGQVILFICDGRIDTSKGANTLEMAQIMKGLGCEGALNLDGGGSTGMWVSGEHINDQTGGNRAVMTTVGFFSKP